MKCISAGINESETHLIQDNDTRWDSTHDLIGSVVTKFKSLKIYSLQYPGKIKEFNMFEEEFLIHCYGILSPFKWVTKMLQGDYPTMSIYYPCINLLLKSMHPSQSVFLKLPNDESGVKIGHDELNSLAKEVRESLLSDLESNIDTKFTFEQKELMGISSFLDPRWKTLSFLEGYARELVNSAAIKQQWYLWNGETYLQQLLQDKSSTPIFQPPKIPKLHRDLGNFMISLLDESNEFTTSHCGIAPEIPDTGLLLSLEEEIKYYQGLPHIDVNTEFNLLTWWREKGVKFHKLYRLGYMASIAHANVASSSVVERLFSAAGRIVNRDRANTKPERVESILLIHKNSSIWMQDSWEQTKKYLWSQLPYLKNLKRGKCSQVSILKQKQKADGKWTPKKQFSD